MGSTRLPLQALTDAAVAAAIAAILGLPLIGFQLIDQAGGEGFATRWPALGAAVLLVFLGSLALSLIAHGAVRIALGIAAAFVVAAIFAPWPSDFLQVVAVGGAGLIGLNASLGVMRQARVDPFPAIGRALQPASPVLPWALVGFALILPALPFADRRVLDVSQMILTYMMLGWGLNVVTGLAGLLDLGYVAFFAIGAYTAAILSAQFGLSFWACLPLSALIASAAGIILGFPVLRLRGDYFAVVTLGFGEIIRIVANNWRSLTNGSQGIASPPPSFVGLAEFTASPVPGQTAFNTLLGIPYSPAQRVIFLYYLILALALAVNFFTLRIRRLPIGRAWEALREDDIACQALGIDRRMVKLAAFAIGAAWGGIGGAFFGAHQKFITPESFSFLESAIITAIVVLGGRGSQLGIVLSALILAGLPEAFRALSEYRMLMFGASMIAIMQFRPQGLVGTRRPSVTMT